MSATKATAGTSTGSTKTSSTTIHHLFSSSFTAEDIQTVDKVYHTVTINTVIFGYRTHIG